MPDWIHPAYFNPVFLLSNLNPKHFFPDLQVDSLAELNLQELRIRGIKGIILDVDNTLCEYHGTSIDEKLKPPVELIRRNFKTCVISNTTEQRRKQLEDYFGLHVVQCSVKKPKPGSYLAAMDYLGTTYLETAMIGDRIMTDITGAKKLGIYTIKVNPVNPKSEPLPVKLARGFENCVFHFYTH